MILRPPRATRTSTLLPDTTRVRSRRAVFLQAFDGELQRDPCARNRRGAGAAIGLDDVAVERDLTFAKRLEIDDRAQAAADQPLDRSEEPTSELQSLMRHSYAVFCLKKNNTANNHLYIHNY